MKKKLAALVGIMLILTAAVALMIQLSNRDNEIESMESRDKLKIVATFYPVYMIGVNIADGIEELEIKSLTDLNTGCLHDYQLTTEDMRRISEAEVLIINGGGMEGFIEDVKANYPGLTMIDTSNQISLLPNEDKHTSEDNFEEEKKTEAKDNSGGNSEEHEHGEWNAHIWLDPALYIKQIENVRDGLISYIKANRANDEKLIKSVEENASNYIDQIMKVDQDVTDYAKRLAAEQATQGAGSKKVVIFHDSFAYLANRLGLTVAHAIPLDSDTSLSAGEIAEIVEEVKKENIPYLFTEEQFSDSIAKQIEEETDATMYIIDSAVTGDGSRDSYLKAMEANLSILKAVMPTKE